MLSAVFFDLDGTLYDRDALVQVVVAEQFEAFRGQLAGVDRRRFIERAFALDAHGYGDKAALYANVVEELGLPSELGQKLERDFWTRYVASCDAPADTVSTLRILKEHGLKLAVVTNGATRIQADKLKALGLYHYFDAVLISGTEGVRKPDPVIFARALKRCRVKANAAAFVGDNPDADIDGAKAAGLRPIWRRVPYWEMTDPNVLTIDSLSEVLPFCLGTEDPLASSVR